MNQKEIEVKLTVSDDTDILLFCLDEDNPQKYSVNLNSPSSQAELKSVFSKLIEILMKDDFKLTLTIMDGYSKGLYKEVCTEYISDLNREIAQVKEAIKYELT